MKLTPSKKKKLRITPQELKQRYEARRLRSERLSKAPKETIEQYLARGGKITVLKPVEPT